MRLLGPLAVFVGMVMVYGLPKDGLGVPKLWAIAAVSILTLVWACWPSKKGGTQP
jgi:hypothetical protein